MEQRTTPGIETQLSEISATDAAEFWNQLIDENAASEFIGVSPRTMQVWRRRCDGPKFVRLSSRCVRYRRSDLRAWAESLVRSSTSDTGTYDIA